ncbi:spinocerebellar ataxia type 10 protein domain-containing protein [Mycena pura]|uniref:Ataxin-10 homolog n=1 Tax=Mycena pura TaxID=153505 RepID=A0AAD7E294_9AGAR|nr:spinocerebellar ataxia type 10 protein domain-containing protein [Mycena pura]
MPDIPDTISPLSLACAIFDVNSHTSVTALAATLEPITAQLAQSKAQRERLGENDALWTDLRKLWRDLSRAQMTFWDNDDSEDEADGAAEHQKQQGLSTLAASLARYTRNLVADVPRNQIKAFENEPSIRRLVHYYTSWTFLQNKEALLVARVLSQALANLVSGNANLGAKLWNTYMHLPEDQVVLIRLLSSPDPPTILAALIIILSCIDGSRTRIKILTRTVVGVRLCVCLLDNMVKLYDADESAAEAKAFDVGYEIFSRIMAADLVPSLFSRLAMTDEIITPHQTTLLKLVDSYLQSTQLSPVPTTPQGTPLYTKLRPMLAKTFFSLSAYAQKSIQNSLGLPTASSDTAGAAFEPLSSLDVMLPKVGEALVLVTQCIVTTALESSDQCMQLKGLEQSSQDFFNDARSADQGILESLVELLRLLDMFLPRINFGKPVPSVVPPQGGGGGGDDSASTGFNYLKRDLVRLLGILCYGKKAVQDRIRLCGGIQVVMNLCVVDERNPFLREHAIFALHNLLQGNPENQAVVDALQPSGKWDDNGILRDTSGAVRK